MFVKHEFTAEQFNYLISIAKANDTTVKALVKTLFRQYVSDQMESNNHDQPEISGNHK